MATLSTKTIVRWAGGLLLGVPALGLILFGPRGSAPVPAGRVVVEYWEKWTGTEGEAMQRVVDSFNATVGRDKGIFVRYLSTSSVDQKTLVATAAGQPPDLAGVWNDNVAQYASMDALLPLDELAAAHGISASTYKKVFWDECRYEGKVYALISTPYDVTLHYNTKMFAAAGIDHPPSTIDELDADAAKLDRLDSAGRLAVVGYLPNEPGWFVDYTCLWFGGRWWDDDHKKFTFTDPAVVRSYRWMQSYAKRLGKDAVSAYRGGAGNYDSPQNPFVTQTLAMEQQGTYMGHTVHVNRPSMDGEWAAAPFPPAVPGLTGVTYCKADVFVIPRFAKHPAEAFEFIAYVNHQDVMEKLCAEQYKSSPLSAVSNGFLKSHPNPYIRVFDELAAGPNAFGTPPVPIMPEVIQELKVFTQRLMQLEVTPEEGLAQVQAKLLKKYDAFMEVQRDRRASER